MQDLVSVIVPVYQVEKYLRHCVQSIIEQSYENLEIILVDDGSTDRSGMICDQLAHGDERIRVFHKSNGGLSDARNFGVKQSSGAYIAFIDSDDAITSNYISYLYDLVKRHNADIACCDYQKIYDFSEQLPSLPVEHIEVYSGKEACAHLMDSKVSACIKLISRDLVIQFPFPLGRKHEDTFTTYKYFYKSLIVVSSNLPLYLYFMNESGITAGLGLKRDNLETRGGGKTLLNRDLIDAYAQRAEYFEKKKEQNLAQIAWSKLIVYLIDDSLQFDRRSDYELRRYIHQRWISSFISPKMKLRIIIYFASPTMFRLGRRIKASKYLSGR